MTEPRLNLLEQWKEVDRRLLQLELLIGKMEARTASLEHRVDVHLDRAESSLSSHATAEVLIRSIADESARKLETQGDAVLALHAMIERTDELLGRVLEHLESSSHSTIA